MNDFEFVRSVSSKPLFEEDGMTSVVSNLDPKTRKQKVALKYPVSYLKVHREVRTLTRKKITYHKIFPTQQEGTARIWCLLDLSNGCAGEATGHLWMFALTTREDARVYRKYLESLRSSGSNVVKVSHVFCMWS